MPKFNPDLTVMVSPIRWLQARSGDQLGLLIMALVIGVGTGFGAIVFRGMIDGFTWLAFDGSREVLGFMGRYYVVIIPAIGGLIIGPLLYFLAPEAKGHGVPEVMSAVALKGGRIRPIVALIKALASSICIGTGGSAGREGPIVQIGSTLGSTVGQFLRLPSNGVRLLVACGAAGGISATFNAPVAGVLFALEVILGEFAVAHFATVVVSSVTASVIARIFLGDVPAFVVSEYALRSAWELPLYALLGVIAAVVGVAFVKMLYWFEDRFDHWKLPDYFKPAIGGIGIGLLGLFYPQVFGVGYGAIEDALHNEMLLTTLVVLVGAKILATSLTLGSGGSGGVFAPSLFIGAMLGGAFGRLVNGWMPDLTAPAGAYALVGMSAVFAGTARAPITAIIILFEMTGDYRIILPLMLTTVIASLVAHWLEPESIYTLKLVRRGVHIERGSDVDVMRSVKVSEVMSLDLTSVDSSMPVNELVKQFEINHHRALPVLKDGKLSGIVTVQDVRLAINDSDPQSLTVGDIASRAVIATSPDESMWAALRKMGPRELSSLPVVDPKVSGRLVGMIRRRDIVRAYNLAMVQKSEIAKRVDQARLDSDRSVGFLEFEVSQDSRSLGLPLKQLGVPKGVTIVSIRRGDRVLIPKGDTVMKAGDQITAFLEHEDRGRLTEIFDTDFEIA